MENNIFKMNKFLKSEFGSDIKIKYCTPSRHYLSDDYLYWGNIDGAIFDKNLKSELDFSVYFNSDPEMRYLRFSVDRKAFQSLESFEYLTNIEDLTNVSDAFNSFNDKKDKTSEKLKTFQSVKLNEKDNIETLINKLSVLMGKKCFGSYVDKEQRRIVVEWTDNKETLYFLLMQSYDGFKNGKRSNFKFNIDELENLPKKDFILKEFCKSNDSDKVLKLNKKVQKEFEL